MSYFLYASGIPYLHLGGASRSVKTLLESLVARGHKCVAVSPSNTEGSSEVNGVFCISTALWGQRVENLIANDHPDIVLAQLAEDARVIRFASRHKVPSILRVPSFSEYMCTSAISFTNCTRFCLTGEPCPHRADRGDLFREATAVITSSCFAAREVRQLGGRNALVLYPPVDPREHLVEKTGDRVTLVTGHVAKGVKTFLKVAQGNKDLKYLIVRNMEPLPEWTKDVDIEVLSGTNDMKTVWRKTRVLLAPSRGSESFGRVCVEANLNGIPVIASRHTGMIEAAGLDSTIPITPGDASEWQRETRKLMTDQQYYATKSEQAKKHAQQFDVESQVDKFVGLADILMQRKWNNRAPYIIESNAMPSVAFFGPWVGELGWEIATWQGWCRRQARKYDKVYVVSFPEMSPLYSDFAEFVPHSYPRRRVIWTHGRGTKFSEVEFDLPHDVSVRVWPIMKCRIKGDFIEFRNNPNSEFSCLIHAASHQRRDKYVKDYPKKLWAQVVAGLPKDTACIGLRSDLHIEGTADMRGIPLDELMSYMAGAKVVIGGSSGPMCLAPLCGTPIVVWGPRNAPFVPLDERFKTVWNPFRTRVEFVPAANWKPPPDRVLIEVRKVIDSQ